MPTTFSHKLFVNVLSHAYPDAYSEYADYEDDYDEKTTMMKRATMIKMTTVFLLLAMKRRISGITKRTSRMKIELTQK